jgi:hypothetical protein
VSARTKEKKIHHAPFGKQPSAQHEKPELARVEVVLVVALVVAVVGVEWKVADHGGQR